MREGFRRHKQLILGGCFVLIGGILLLQGVPFVAGWLQFLASGHEPVHPPCATMAYGLCYEIIAKIPVPPNPYPLLAAYGVAIPAVFALTWWMLRRSTRAIVPTSRRSGWSRAAGFLLIGAMGGVAGLIASGFVLAWLSLPTPLWLRDLFLASVLVVPTIVLGVGAALLVRELRERLNERPRASRE